MNCSKCRKMLNDYVDDLLLTGQKKSVEIHLNDCADCAKEFEELRRVRTMIKSLDKIDLPDSFEQNLFRAIKDEGVENKIKHKDRFDYSGILKWAGAAAALFLLLFGILASRLDLSNLNFLPREADHAVQMEAAELPPVAEEAAEEAADANQRIAALEEPAVTLDRESAEADKAQEAILFAAEEPAEEFKIRTNFVELITDNPEVTLNLIISIAEKNGIEVLDLGCSGLSLRVTNEHRKLLYAELSLLGRINYKCDKEYTDTLAITIIYGAE